MTGINKAVNWKKIWLYILIAWRLIEKTTFGF